VIRIRCANAADSPELCRLVRDVPLSGDISLAYARDPDFFAALPAEGRLNQVVVAIDNEGISTMAIRSIRPVYVNGTATDLGYLHGLRSRPGRSRFGRGFLFVRSLHEGDRLVPAYLITVIAGNRKTRLMFEKKRSVFPRFEPFGTLVTHAVLVGRKKARRTLTPAVAITTGSTELLPEMLRFLNQRHATRQFAPVLDEAYFSNLTALGLRPESFLVTMDGNRIRGMLALWDQSAFKQCIVSGYHGWLRVLRPFANGYLHLRGFHSLPIPGKPAKIVYGCFVAVEKDDPRVLDFLLDEACRRLAGTGAQFLILSLHERDPLAKAFNNRPCIRYQSLVYLGAWEDGAAFCRTVSHTPIPYLEACTL
jgi:hypothetical protein